MPVVFTSSEPETRSASSTNANSIRDVSVFKMGDFIVIPWPLALHIFTIIELIKHHNASPRLLPCPILQRGRYSFPYTDSTTLYPVLILCIAFWSKKKRVVATE